MANAPKTVSPLVGFNNNVKHKGHIFHVQTEDSGIQRPRIVTHLFVDGGRIIKSTKTDYSEHVGRRDMVAVVRRLMKEQHKAMFIALRDGQFDGAIAELCGDSSQPATPAPSGVSTATVVTTPAGSPPSAPTSAPAPVVSPVPVPVKSVPVDGEPRRRATPPPVPRRPAPATLKDYSLAGVAAPPENPAAAVVQPESTAPPDRTPPATKATPSLGTQSVEPEEKSRYASPRPAAIFSEGATPESTSIFGGSSISEQSLDEVILSYLAEDLDGPPPEK